jgi:hypothetical protein
MKRSIPFLLIALLFITGCNQIPGLSKPTPSRSSNTTSIPTPSTQIEQAATILITALATVDYRNPQAWKDTLNALSNDDGKKFWQQNAAPMLKDVLAHKRVTESVKIEQVSVLERQQLTNSQGKNVAAAVVLVTGRVTYADEVGRHDEPINQPFLLANLDGSWKFVVLISPSVLNAPGLVMPTPGIK